MYRSKLLKSFAILGAVAALSLTAAGAEAKVLKSSTKHFYVTLDGDGSKTTIAKIGTLVFTAQCEVDPLEEDEVKILVKNTKGAWFDSEDGNALRAGRRIVLLSESDESGESNFEEDDAAVATNSGLNSRPNPSTMKRSARSMIPPRASNPSDSALARW